MKAPGRRDRTEGRVALVHDFLVSLRGADRVFLEICDLWPDADVFTTIYDDEGTHGRFAGRRIHTSFLQRLRPTARTFRALLPLYPKAIESFDLSGYDLVVSSSSAWAHAVRRPADAVHVSYCHNPFRYLWNEYQRTLAERRDPITRWLLRDVFRRWRAWDLAASRRVDAYVTNSVATRERIRRCYRRESTVVYPPVDTARFTPGPPGDHYLVLSELVTHKRIDTIVTAFSELGLPLVVVGDGPHAGRLRRLAAANVSFAGRVSDHDVDALLTSCRALVVAANEEFGIAAVEAQAAGRPVIARAAGGVIETVLDGVTGCFWSGDADDLARAVAGFDDRAIRPSDCVENAARFDSSVFRAQFPSGVRRAIELAQGAPGEPDRNRERPFERPAAGVRA
jgi:glycosyltransferase involved in cell wall biosynthesis